MKVYVVTQGSYSEYHICGVSLDREEAEKLAKICSESDELAEVEEYDTNDNAKAFRFKRFFHCERWMSEIEIDEVPPYSVKELNVVNEYDDIYVNADDEKMALKIAADIYAKHDAEIYGL